MKIGEYIPVIVSWSSIKIYKQPLEKNLFSMCTLIHIYIYIYMDRYIDIFSVGISILNIAVQ